MLIHWCLEDRKHSSLAMSHLQKLRAAGLCSTEVFCVAQKLCLLPTLVLTCTIIPQTNNFLVLPKCWLPSSHHHIQIQEGDNRRERCNDYLRPLTQPGTIHLLCAVETTGQRHFRWRDRYQIDVNSEWQKKQLDEGEKSFPKASHSSKEKQNKNNNTDLLSHTLLLEFI